jgi:hypothetical protein
MENTDESLEYWEKRIEFHQAYIDLKSVADFVNMLFKTVHLSKIHEQEMEAMNVYQDIWSGILPKSEILKYD